MELKDFILKTKSLLLAEKNDTLVLDWIKYACDCAESTKSSIEDELENIYLSLAYVKNNFSAGVLCDSLRTLLLATKIIGSAMYLEAGCSTKQLEQLALDGKLECDYLPSTDSEIGTLTLVQIDDPQGGFFLARNEPLEVISRAVRQASRAALSDNRKISEVLCDWRVRIEAITDTEQQMILLHNFQHNSAIGNYLMYWPKDDTLQVMQCPALEQDEDEEYTVTSLN